MEFCFGFGKSKVSVNVPEKNLLGCLMPNPMADIPESKHEIKRALENPIGSPRLKKILQPGEKVAIITSDITRPMPSKLVLPILLEEMSEAGVRDQDIIIIFGLGTHRAQTEQEKRYLVGDDIFDRISCVDSNPLDCVHLGSTANGTPVDIFRRVAEADRRICLGNIEYHYFAGYSGGAKAIMPGVSTKAAIQANHCRMVEENARAGKLEGNPVRKDIDEVVNFLSIDFILNVVLDEKKNVVKAVAGDYIQAHREGCKFLDSLYQVKIPKPADIVITSPGGYPKDINLYQAQKALDNSKYAVRSGGIIILVASCKEGLGEHTFEQWMLEASHSHDLIDKIQKNFQLGGHKAAAIALILENAKIFLVSDLDADFVRNLFMEPYADVQSALDAALEQLGSDSGVYIMPVGGSTLPVNESMMSFSENIPKNTSHSISFHRPHGVTTTL
jgi:nickel-dependent lactate racemase